MGAGSQWSNFSNRFGLDRGSKGIGSQWLLLGVTAVATVAVALRLVSLHGTGTASDDHFQFFKSFSSSSGIQSTLTEASAGLYGHIHKQGPLNFLNWHRDKFGARRQAFAAWLWNTGFTDPTFPPETLKRMKNRRVDLSQPPPVYPACHIFVNHQYRFMYLRHAKAASTSLLKFFGNCKGETSSHNSTCLERFDLGDAQHLPLEELEALWHDYFVFSFVRNPWSRAVSSYLMMMRSLEREPVAQEKGEGDGGQQTGSASHSKLEQFVVQDARQYGWDDFCKDPASFHRICDQDAKCSTRTVKHTVAHIQAQFPCLSTADGGWALDFIGRVEHVDEDLNAVLEVLDSRRGEGVPPLGRLEKLSNVNGRSCSEKDPLFFPQVPSYEVHCDREEYFRGVHSQCAQQLGNYYAMDVEHLKFDVPGESGKGEAKRTER